MEIIEVQPLAIPEQIARMAEARARAVALSQGSRSMTYEELHRKADGLAATFRARGVRPGGTVAICVERSFDGIAAALGAMRAGAAYVPLDPGWPEQRLRDAIEDSGAGVLVAREEMATGMDAGIVWVDPGVDVGCAKPARAKGAEPAASIDPESLAYVIYTSGSSGVPKGVEITHANLAHLVAWHRAAFAIRGDDRASHVAGLGFDAAVWEVWSNLCAGATVVLLDDEEARRSAEGLQGWLLRERVTIGFVPTVHAGPMMQMRWPESTALRILLTGGDTLHQGPAADLPFAVFNNYGPTECTVVSTSGVVRAGSSETPSIGSAIVGASVYLLDESGLPAVEGAAGEIYVGGGGVGRGYRHRESETEKSFLPDPFAGDPGARMFRTGDRAMRLGNGELRFLGRLDRQVKIRGQRVELDEIGVLLSRHPKVEFATAAVVSVAGREPMLVGYVLPRDTMEAPSAGELKAHLRVNLPEYMVPAALVQLKEIPLTASAKIDYARLPLPASAAPEAALTVVAKLLAIVRRLLENETLGDNEDFYLAGGDSLLGMQLVMEVQNEFGLKIGLQELFEARTVVKLTRRVERFQREKQLTAMWKEVLGGRTVGVEEDFYELGGSDELAMVLCEKMAAQTGQKMTVGDFRIHRTIRRQAEVALGWEETVQTLPPGVVAVRSRGSGKRIFWAHYLSANLARAIGDEWPFLSVTLTAEDVSGLGAGPTLEKIGACMVGKIRCTQPEGPYIVGGLCLGGVLAWEIASQLRAAGEEVRLLVVIDPPSPLSATDSLSLSRRWAYLRYAVKRAEWLGMRTTMRYSAERLIRTLPRRMWKRFGVEDIHLAQEIMENAVLRYRPGTYDRRVLLVLASERVAAADEPGAWAKLASRRLDTEYVEAYHRELMDPANAGRIAKIIASYLEEESEERSEPPEPAGYAMAI